MQGQTAGVNTNVDNETRNFDPKQAFGLTSNMGKFGTAVTIGVGLATSGIKGGIRGALIEPDSQLAYALHQSQGPSMVIPDIRGMPSHEDGRKRSWGHPGDKK